MSILDTAKQTKELASKATPEPVLSGSRDGRRISVTADQGFKVIMSYGPNDGENNSIKGKAERLANCELWIHARTAAPQLADAVIELVAALDMAVYDLERIRDADWTAEQMRLGARSGAHVARELLAKFGVKP